MVEGGRQGKVEVRQLGYEPKTEGVRRQSCGGLCGTQEGKLMKVEGAERRG